MVLIRDNSLLKINKKDIFEDIVIENNLENKIDQFENIITNIFIVNGIKNVKYIPYSKHDQNRNNEKLMLHIRTQLVKDHKINTIIHVIEEILDYCNFKNEFIKVNVSEQGLSTVFPPLNTIELSARLMNSNAINENENINIIDIKNGIIKTVCVRCSDNLDHDLIALNPSNREIFLKSNEVYIQKKRKIEFQKVAIQKVNEILDGFVTIAEDYKPWVENNGANKYELTNEVTGASLDIDVDKIKFAKLDERIIKLNYFQRLVLEVELPQKIPEYYYKKFQAALEYDDKSYQILRRYFENEKALTSEILKEDKDMYNHKRRIKAVLNECAYPILGLYPLSKADKCNGLIYKLLDKILDIMIGSNKIHLKCIRPYQTDESSNVVRLSKSTLELLGIDETDNLIISYRNQRVKARALVINEIESIKETNIIQAESELNVCIGIPAYIRQQLGMSKINTCCVVERDKRYLFRKNLNIQFISIVATILTVKQTFNNANNLTLITLLLLFTPISVYIILSAVRNRISNK